MRSITLRDLEDLGWKRFEDLVAALVLEDHADAEKMANPDGGADVLLERRSEGARVWQAKHFPRRVHWPQCVDSLDEAVELHGAKEVTFVFPRDMSRPVKKSFKEKLQERHAGVLVTYMSGSQVIAALRKQGEERIDEFFGPDPRSQAREIATHLAKAGLQVSRRPQDDALSHGFQLADEAARRDRYFRTDVSLTTGATPARAWAEDPVLQMTSTGGGRKLQIAAWLEEGLEEDLLLDLWLGDGEEGDDARWEVAKALAREGKAKLPPGTIARLRRIPEAVKAIAGESGGDLEDVTLSASASHPVKLVGEHKGVRVERTMEVVTVPPLQVPPSWERTYEFGCLDGELALFLNFSPKEETVTVGFNFSFGPIGPEIPEGVVDALRLLVASDEGSGHWEAPTLLPVGPIPFRSSKNGKRHEENLSALAFFKSLRTIEGALPVDRFRIEAEEITEEENEAAQIAAETLEDGRGYYELDFLRVDMPAVEVEAVRRTTEASVVGRLPIETEILGRRVLLGVGEAELPKPDEISVVEGTHPSRRELSVRWADKPRIPFHLIDDAVERVREVGIWTADRVPELPQ